jgi:hypothetical protein
MGRINLKRSLESEKTLDHFVVVQNPKTYPPFPGSGDRLLLNRGSFFTRSFKISFREPIQLAFDGLNLANDLGDDFSLIQGRKETHRIGQNSCGVMEAA